MGKTLRGFVFGLPLGMLGAYLALRRRRQAE
jgi:MYXO-CTERM domain-containing protein